MQTFDIRTQETQQRIVLILTGVLILSYTLWMSYETILRYDTFKATAFDLGNMDQVLWNTLHGRLFQFTNQGSDFYGPPTRLAIHVEPIILPLSLLYLFHADARLLLVFQTLMIAAGGWPVYVLTRKYIPTWPFIAPVMVLAYYLMPSLLSLNLFDFHPLSLATPFLLYAVLALEYKHYGWFLFACILASACKEDVPLAVALLGVLVIWKYKLPRLGTMLLLGGTLWSLIAFLVVIPHFYPGAVHSNYWYRYESLGSSPGVAIVNILLHPWLLFMTFITLDRFYYIASLLRSTGFLALLAPQWLLPALPALAINLFSDYPLYYSGGYHYNAVIIPFIMLSAIHGMRRFLLHWCAWRDESGSELGSNNSTTGKETTLSRWLSCDLPFQQQHIILLQEAKKRANSAYTVFLAFIRPVLVRPAFAHSLTRMQQTRPMLLHVYMRQRQTLDEHLAPLAKRASLSPMQWWMSAWIVAMLLLNVVIMAPQLNVFWADHTPGTREQHINQLLAMIPPNASVSAGENLNPHLSQRLYITVFPAITFATSKNINNTVQYIIVDVQSIFPEDRIGVTNVLNQLVNSKQFRILAEAEGVKLLVRRDT
ncbi:MAG: hypothetical protein NVSMB38_06260 [Ktedonobacteraceae bacterium]